MDEPQGNEPYFADEPQRRAEEAQAELKRLVAQIAEDQRQHREKVRELTRMLLS